MIILNLKNLTHQWKPKDYSCRYPNPWSPPRQSARIFWPIRSEHLHFYQKFKLFFFLKNYLQRFKVLVLPENRFDVWDLRSFSPQTSNAEIGRHGVLLVEEFVVLDTTSMVFCLAHNALHDILIDPPAHAAAGPTRVRARAVELLEFLQSVSLARQQRVLWFDHLFDWIALLWAAFPEN